MHFTVQAPGKPTPLQEGDEVLLYQTVKPNSKEQPGLTALCCVASAPYPDPSEDAQLGRCTAALPATCSLRMPV